MVTLSTRSAAGTSSSPAAKIEGFVTSVMALAGPPPVDEPLFLNRWEKRAELGFLWIFLACLAPLADPRPAMRHRARLAGLVIAVTIASALLFPWIPGLSLFNHPVRMILFLTFPLALLAGVTCEAIQSGSALAMDRRAAPLLAVGLFPLLSIAALLSTGWLRDRAISDHFLNYWLVALGSSALALILLRRAAGSWSAPLVACLLLLDAWWLGEPMVATMPLDVRYPTPECVRFLKDRDEDHGRVFTLGPQCSDPSPLGFGLGVLRRVERIGGYGPLDIFRYRWLLFLLTGQQQSTIASQMVSALPVLYPTLLDTLGAKYLLAPEEEAIRACSDTFDPLRAVSDRGSPAPWKKIFVDPQPRTYSGLIGQHVQFPPYAVYENPQYNGRTFWVGEAERLQDEEHRTQQILTNDYRRVVLLEDPVAVERAKRLAGAGAGVALEPVVELDQLSPDRIQIRVHCARDGFLVIADPWFPGWRATIDGRETPVLRANVAMRAVEVPAGRHQVTLTFLPDSFRRGRTISLATLALCLGILAIAALRARFPARLRRPA